MSSKTKHKQNTFLVYFRYIAIAIIFFLIGFFYGMHINPLSPEKISLLLKTTSTTYDLLNLQYSFVLTNLDNCTLSREFINTLSDNVGKMGQTLAQYDLRNIKNEYYYFLKEYYHLFQIKLYFIYKAFLEHCDGKENIILFFWGQNNESILQGKYLTELVEKYKNIHVFAVEGGYSKAYEFLEKYYNINETPVIIVNYDQKFEGLTPKETIEKYLIR